MQITTTNVELTVDDFPCRTYVVAPSRAQLGVQKPAIGDRTQPPL